MQTTGKSGINNYGAVWQCNRVSVFFFFESALTCEYPFTFSICLLFVWSYVAVFRAFFLANPRFNTHV